MQNERKDRFFLKLLMWFTFLSTLGVGGGIFFLLFAVVPIEQTYTDRGWSQFKIDNVMKYFVLGWVVFGFIASFLYYFLILKKNRWVASWLLVIGSVFLCISGMYYFLNTGNGIVQASQGEIVEGDRFTFGPYPEKEDLVRLHEQGYDGVITLLNPTLPIEKPLLDKEKASVEEIDLELISIPMLPWVGDNSKSIQRVKQLIQQDDKKYYVHCYLGRHRVDVIKQVINEELGDDTYALNFMQPTTLERGELFNFPDQAIMIGPFPTDEEWFTRIKRGGVKEVVSLLPDSPSNKWQSKAKQVTKEMGIDFTAMPISQNPTLEEVRTIVNYVEAAEHKVYVHAFQNNTVSMMAEALIDWDATLVGDVSPTVQCGSAEWVGRKYLIGCSPSEEERTTLRAIGVEQFIDLDGMTLGQQYEQLKRVKHERRPSYIITSRHEQEQVKQVAVGLLYGSMTGGQEWETLTLAGATPIRHERNLLLGPMLLPEEYESFALEKGVAQIILLYSPSTTSEETLTKASVEAERRGISIRSIPLVNNYEKDLISLIESENGLNYIMTEKELLPLVNTYIKKF